MDEFEDRIDYGINYVRNTIIGLSMKHKPVIVSGIYVYDPELSYSTFLNIKPYKRVEGKTIVTKTICNHISVWDEYVIPYFDFQPDHNKHRFYLICEAYTYQSNGITRGGLRPTDQLKVNPIIPFSEEYRLHDIPQDKYIDFFDFADGKYAWIFGEQFIDKKLIKKEKKHLKKKQKTVDKPEITLNTLSNGVVIPEYPLHVNKHSTKYKKAFQTLSSEWIMNN